jgi:hypothetical protein
VVRVDLPEERERHHAAHQMRLEQVIRSLVDVGVGDLDVRPGHQPVVHGAERREDRVLLLHVPWLELDGQRHQVANVILPEQTGRRGELHGLALAPGRLAPDLLEPEVRVLHVEEPMRLEQLREGPVGMTLLEHCGGGFLERLPRR